MQPHLLVARQIARNLAAAVRVPAATDLVSGAELTPAAAAAYADGAYRTFIRTGVLTPQRLSGARMVEVGPGESLALALRMVAAGAREVVAVDRFPVLADIARQRKIYSALLKELASDQRARAEEALDRSIVRLLAVAVEQAADELEPRSFDIAYSVAALQHVSDPEAALHALDRLLVPGGLMTHQIDFGDMGLFTGRGMHPLTFLTIPERRYRWMGSNLGIPNRALLDRYRTTLDSLGYELDITATNTIDASEASVEEMRPRMLREYRTLPLADLVVGSAMIVARKPDRV